MPKYKDQVLPSQFDENIMTDKNSLVANLNKLPALSRKIIDLYSQHTITWLTEKTSRFASEELKDQSFRWKITTQITKPTILTGEAFAASINGSGGVDIGAALDPTALVVDSVFAFNAHHDHSQGQYGTELHPNDMVRLQSGATAIILNHPVDKTGKAQYAAKFIGGDSVAADFADGAIVGFIGSAFGEGSLGGFMSNQYSDWYISYTTINRAATKITATAATNVEWITDGEGYALWYFQQEKVNDKKFFRGVELQRRYSRSSMDPSQQNDIMGASGKNNLTLSGFHANNGSISAPQVGDGLYAQFEDANSHGYEGSTGLVVEQLRQFIAILAQKAIGGGNSKKEWLVLAGMIGMIEFQKIMEKLVVSASPGGSYTDLATGRDMALGTNFTTYYYLGHKITMVYDETLDDPSLHRSQGGLTGNGDLIFLDFSTQDGVANIEMKSAYKRSFIKKYLNGMHSYNNKTEAYAVSGYDGAGSEILSESAMVLRVPQSSGMLYQVGDRADVAFQKWN